MELPDEFEPFFVSATGNTPYEYQRALWRSSTPPSILEIPTGAGKTHAVLVAWLYERLVKRRGPRRHLLRTAVVAVTGVYRPRLR